ncbi:SDR family NAD(P)-dependent oxidoreductase, partial [Brevundimonas sp.]|uniref:saccharopine dehydrogenase family protein n=1 Tax=Brevundimonas sp. TaxID=1871086 RepID=UPI0025F4ACEA
MTRVLVIGAGGVFGSRLAEGLLRNGFEVVVAGRSADRAAAVAERLRDAPASAVVRTAVVDTTRVTAEQIRATGAGIVADCAGPFQGARPTVASAAIAAGLHYVDLADARDFVGRFPELDEAAREEGLVALTGCSSTPALSHAVLDDLTAGWREVVSVEAAISPGARAPRGLSVMQAILSWLGRPVRVFEGGGWRDRPGWSGLHLRDMGRAGRRWVSLCETPDLDLLPQRFAVRERAWFLAGLEPAAAHFGAWLLGKFSALTGARLTALAPSLVRLSGLLSPFGSDRGAMRVEAYGLDAEGRSVRAVWLLTAVPGAGPVTPSLPALAAIKAIARGGVAAGARACVGVLSREDIEAEMAGLGLATASTVERAALYRRAIGPEFDGLPAPIRALHETPGRSVWTGRARATGAANPLAALVARLIGFAGDDPDCEARVEIEADGLRSVWRRRIGKGVFSSVLSHPRDGGRVRERFGLAAMDLRLTTSEGRL